MSRNSKNRRLHEQARQMSAQRKQGKNGPARTASKHGKQNVQWNRQETKTLREARINGGKVKRTIAEKVKAGESLEA